MTPPTTRHYAKRQVAATRAFLAALATQASNGPHAPVDHDQFQRLYEQLERTTEDLARHVYAAPIHPAP